MKTERISATDCVRIQIAHPTEDVEFIFSYPMYLDDAESGDRDAIGYLFSECAFAISRGFPIPSALAEFIANRLTSVSRLLTAKQGKRRTPTPLKPRAVQSALLGDLKKGGAARKGPDLKRIVQESYKHHASMGRRPDVAKENVINEIQHYFGVEVDLDYLDRLLAPSSTKGTPPKRKSGDGETK